MGEVPPAGTVEIAAPIASATPQMELRLPHAQDTEASLDVPQEFTPAHAPHDPASVDVGASVIARYKQLLTAEAKDNKEQRREARANQAMAAAPAVEEIFSKEDVESSNRINEDAAPGLG